MITVSFEQINDLGNNKKDTPIMRGDLYQAPLEGQVINLNGNPFVVHEVSWAIVSNGSLLAQFCYVRCLPRPSAQK
jgi:hypothetical protein